MSERVDELSQLKLSHFPELYSTLEVPDVQGLLGYYRGSIVGPAWFRFIARPLLAIAGLGGWWGKYFEGDERATNLVERGGRLQRRLPVKLLDTISMVDKKPALALHYLASNPFPWPYIVDELRQLEPGVLLGMMIVNIGVLRRLSFPFLLRAWEQVNGL